MVEKTTEQYHDDFEIYVAESREVSEPFGYMKALADSVIDGEDSVRLIGYFGALYDVGAAWAFFNLLTPNDRPTPAWFEANAKWFRPMKPARRTANTDETLSRVICDIHEILPRWVDVSQQVEDFDSMVKEVKRVWSMGDYFATRVAYGILRNMNPRIKMEKTPISKHTDRGFQLLYPGVKQTQETSEWLIEEFGVTYQEIGSFLCDFKSMVNGKLYPAYNPDDNWGQLNRNIILGMDIQDVLNARAMYIPEWSRGEEQGWEGRRPEKMTYYRSTGKVWTDRPQGEVVGEWRRPYDYGD